MVATILLLLCLISCVVALDWANLTYSASWVDSGEISYLNAVLIEEHIFVNFVVSKMTWGSVLPLPQTMSYLFDLNLISAPSPFQITKLALFYNYYFISFNLEFVVYCFLFILFTFWSLPLPFSGLTFEPLHHPSPYIACFAFSGQ